MNEQEEAAIRRLALMMRHESLGLPEDSRVGVFLSRTATELFRMLQPPQPPGPIHDSEVRRIRDS
jgi:hypothetical protein